MKPAVITLLNGGKEKTGNLKKGKKSYCPLPPRNRIGGHHFEKLISLTGVKTG